MHTTIWLVRHGQTQYNHERRYQSYSDSPLTSYGQRQTRAVAERLQRQPFDLALVSPTIRTEQTLATILGQRAPMEVRSDAAWAETHHGRWEGLTYREVMAQFPAEAAARWTDTLHGRTQGGESLAEVYVRVRAAWQQLLQQAAGKHILIVTHATPIQLVLCESLGLPPSDYWHWRVDTGSITCIDVYPTGAILRMVNYIPRLEAGEP